jgi:hypothetical protein
MALSASALASGPLGTEFRISTVGTDGVAAHSGKNPAIAYNSTANEYLVVWRGDGLATAGEWEIFGQLVSATGAEIGSDFRISNVGTDTDATRDAIAPAVAYNSADDEYLVTWEGDGFSVDDEFDIFGQRLSATGTELGTNDFRISTMGTDGNADQSGITSGIAYNSTDDEYLVTWEGDGFASPDYEVFGQRLSNLGALLGPRLQVSSMGTGATGAGFDADVAYNSTDNEYLVTWEGDGLVTDEEFEIFGQRVSAAGAEVAPDDFRISDVGTDGVAARDASKASVAYNSSGNEYLVVWYGDGLAVNDEFEIFGQRVSAAGAEAGGDFRISNVGTDTDAARDASHPSLTYDPTLDRFLVTWGGDGLATDEEEEIFGQDVSAAGAEVDSDFRISNTGADGDATRDAEDAVLAYNPTANEYVVVWQADGLATNDEFEIFGRRFDPTVASTPVQPPPAAPTPPPSNDLVFIPGVRYTCLATPTGHRGITCIPPLKVKVPGPGSLLLEDAAVGGHARGLSAPARKKKAKIKPVAATAVQAGTVTLKLKLTKAGSKALRAKRKLKLTAAVTFTPTGGTANTENTKLKLKLKKPKKNRL